MNAIRFDSSPAAALRPVLLLSLSALLLAACARPPDNLSPQERDVMAPDLLTDDQIRSLVMTTEHRDSDDLLSAGLGLSGLQSMLPPAVADAESPTAAELRRRAIWSNWRGIADLSPAGAYGKVYGDLRSVPGREFQQLLQLPGGGSHRVLLQLPDHFDPKAPCLLVTASSGSRGIYGAIALSGAWGLPRGCAVVYTDKGAGTDLFDTASGYGAALDGTPTASDAVFAPSVTDATAPWIAYSHAHSGVNPEADWGRYLRQAGEFALQQLSARFSERGRFTFDNTRVIAVGISNGGGAVLRAAGIEDDWLDGVVAVAPNILPAAGGRPLYDYATEAAQWMTCAQSADALADAPLPLADAIIAAQRSAACQQLIDAGDLQPERTANDAYARLRASGWTDAALKAATLSTAFDLWRAVAVTYASSYLRTAVDQMPCGFGFALLDGSGQPRAALRAERALWWSDSSGIAPGNGIAVLHRDGSPLHSLNDARCLAELWSGQGAQSEQLRQSVAATTAGLPRKGLPVLVIHGVDDGLVPEAFSAAPYVASARAQGREDVNYWRVHNAQHFDAFLGLPAFAARYVPLLPYGYAGLDAMWQRLEAARPISDQTITPVARGLDQGQPRELTSADLALPN